MCGDKTIKDINIINKCAIWMLTDATIYHDRILLKSKTIFIKWGYRFSFFSCSCWNTSTNISKHGVRLIRLAYFVFVKVFFASYIMSMRIIKRILVLIEVNVLSLISLVAPFFIIQNKNIQIRTLAHVVAM